MALLGVIGGLGPMATAYFMQLVTSITDAKTDQDHIRMLIYSAPDIPDRTEYILGLSDRSPLPGIVSAGQALVSMGADVIAIPCITAHCFHSEIESRIPVKILNAIRDSASLLSESGVRSVGLMATEGTVRTGLFQRELEQKGISLLLPDEEDQRAVTSLIYNDVKRGGVPDMDSFFHIKEGLLSKGAEVVLLGCTELSVIKRDFDVGPAILDVMEVLAYSSIAACGKHARNNPVIF